jgi:hypothetical protein
MAEVKQDDKPCQVSAYRRYRRLHCEMLNFADFAACNGMDGVGQFAGTCTQHGL